MLLAVGTRVKKGMNADRLHSLEYDSSSFFFPLGKDFASDALAASLSLNTSKSHLKATSP